MSARREHHPHGGRPHLLRNTWKAAMGEMNAPAQVYVSEEGRACPICLAGRCEEHAIQSSVWSDDGTVKIRDVGSGDELDVEVNSYPAGQLVRDKEGAWGAVLPSLEEQGYDACRGARWWSLRHAANAIAEAVRRKHA